MLTGSGYNEISQKEQYAVGNVSEGRAMKKRSRFTAVLIALFFCITSIASAEQSTGKVVGATDGDTIEVMQGDNSERHIETG